MLSVFSAAFQSVLTLFAFVAAGFILRKTGVVKPDFSAQVSKILMLFFIPCMLIDMVLTSVEFSDIAENYLLIVVSILVIGAGIGVGWLLWLLLRKKGCPFAVPSFSISFSNFGFMGIPVVAALYGNGASASILLYTLPLYLFVNIIGYILMTAKKQINWKDVFNPCTLAILAGFLLKLLPFEMPEAVTTTLKYASNVVSPMAMLSVGLVIGGCSVGRLRENFPLYIISAVRLIVFPVVLLGVLWLIGFRGYSLAVPVIISAMPVAANMTILAGASGMHEEISARVVFISTLLSLVTIPIVAGLIPRM